VHNSTFISYYPYAPSTILFYVIEIAIHEMETVSSWSPHHLFCSWSGFFEIIDSILIKCFEGDGSWRLTLKSRPNTSFAWLTIADLCKTFLLQKHVVSDLFTGPWLLTGTLRCAQVASYGPAQSPVGLLVLIWKDFGSETEQGVEKVAARFR